MRESEARYKAIFESAREGILVGIIETRQIMYANPAICKMFGYTAEEMTRLTINDIHPKEQLRYVSDRFEALVRTEEAFTQNIPAFAKTELFFTPISTQPASSLTTRPALSAFSPTQPNTNTPKTPCGNPKPDTRRYLILPPKESSSQMLKRNGTSTSTLPPAGCSDTPLKNYSK